ncbi:MAG TPA: hypothetical protein VG253_02625 [Streptosporangiaceae bacterium]|nr:hypothetical protein [Streptosporangiaceae bacterium]
MSPALAIAPKQPTRAGWALLLTSVAFFMVTLDSLVVAALPAIHRELGGQVSTLEWAVSAYLLVFAAGIITAASTGEHRRALRAATGVRRRPGAVQPGLGGLRPGPQHNPPHSRPGHARARGSDRDASEPHDPHHGVRARMPWARDRDMELHRRPGRGRRGTPSEFRSSPASVPANPPHHQKPR